MLSPREDKLNESKTSARRRSPTSVPLLNISSTIFCSVTPSNVASAIVFHLHLEMFQLHVELRLPSSVLVFLSRY
ncbi:hypothetical protein PC119_g24606 [Phytophthora cactorum]|nr:hypothetical protein PC119_g24606 [Phytophthora cactorum]